MKCLKDLAKRGKTIVFSIHQPRPNVYDLFDYLLLVSQGRVAYCGPAKDAQSHFLKLGYKMPDSLYVADYLSKRVLEN